MQRNPAAPTPPDLLSITAIPNGVVETVPPGATYRVGDLRASIVLTPSLASASTLGAANFNLWPRCLQQLTWTVAANAQTVTPVLETPVEPEQNIRLYWNAIFGASRAVLARKGKSVMTSKSAWLATHNIVKVGERHSRHRFHQCNMHLLQNAKKRRIPLTSVPPKIASGTDNQAAAQLSLQRMEETAAPVIYLYPQLTPAITAELAAVKNANTLIGTLTGAAPDAPHQAWLSRLASARKILEIDENETLRACSLLALMALCATDNSNVTLPDVMSAVATAYLGVPSDPGADLTTMQYYMATLLFQRRKPKMKAQDELDTPDFHQTLGLLQSYPALLRPLGLILDVVIPRAGIVDGAFKLSATFICADLPGGLVKQVSNTTNVTLRGTAFFTTAQDPNYIDERMLALNSSTTLDPNFALITEDTDSTAAKFMQSSNSDDRANEYFSTAPDPLVVQDVNDVSAERKALKDGTPDPTSPAIPSLASARTCGIALQQSLRLQTLQASASVLTSDAPGTRTQDLFAEQLVLGFRVDVYFNTRWFSLCRRSTRQYLLGSKSGTQLEWKPTSKAELEADEGFVTLGATSSDTPDPTAPAGTAPTDQIHIHQTIFNWTGGSLVLPPLPTPEPTLSTRNPAPDSQHRLAVRATYNLPDEHSLVPLRFNADYTFRCRVVDLAGNSHPFAQGSIQLTSGTAQQLPVHPMFSRQEPIRGPQFLLTDPLDPVRRPSEHIDRVVLRNGEDDGEKNRIMVPPRESLHFAELHGVLKDSELPPTAFGNRALTRKGAFPSVRLALKNNWIDDPNSNPDPKSSEVSDPIFINLDSTLRVTNPYYPDPLANYIRIEAWLLSDTTPVSSQLDGSPLWLDLNPNNDWPNFLAARVRLQAADRNAPASIERASLPFDWNHPLDQAPTLTVKLPPAATVTLSISSAAVSYDSKSPRKEGGRTVSSGVAAFYRAQYYAATLLDEREPLQSELQAFLQSLQSSDFVNGALPPVTPPATMTLVHAVRRPEAAPHLDTNFKVIRNPGDTAAQVSGNIFAHWLSTGKVTCHATYSDIVDDPKNPAPVNHTFSEAAFDLTPETTPATPADPNAPDQSPPSDFYSRPLKNLQHKFRDTRAHDVTYSLVAATRFREYYPTTEKPSTFNKAGEHKFSITVCSSVRPVALSIAYIIPTFTWQKSREKGNPVLRRAVGARVYLHPPFGLSGNRECICVAFATPQNPTPLESQPTVSRWAADPTRTSAGMPTTVIQSNQVGDPADPANATVALLAEGGLAEVNIFPVTHAPERRLWFADIPFHAPDALDMPFFRLALARWQPDAHFDHTHNTALEARISPVIFADFMQLTPGRWASVSRQTNSHYTITVSGFFAPPIGADITCSMEIELQSRWYAMGADLGWRTIELAKSPSTPSTSGQQDFVYTPPTLESPAGQWTIEVHLPHSAIFRKYRILIREREHFAVPTNEAGSAGRNPSRGVFTQFIDLP